MTVEPSGVYSQEIAPDCMLSLKRAVATRRLRELWR